MSRETKIRIMNNNLKHIRRMLNLTSEDLGTMIGVTKQTISNIECGRTKLSTTQYLAILYVLTYELGPNLTRKELDNLEKLLTFKVVERDYIEMLTFEEES